MKILNEKQMAQKIQRMAVQMLENNFDITEIIFAGINKNGFELARLLSENLRHRSNIEIILTRLRLNPADPSSNPIFLDIPVTSLNDKVIIIVDDVANTGRTIFYAVKPLLEILPKKVEVAVLVDRKHKSFPIQADYVGLSLATTRQENIEVRLSGEGERGTYLN